MKTNRGLGTAILAAIFLCISSSVFAVLSGAGTEASPYLIQSRADFDEFANSANATLYWASGIHTKLMCDPNLAGAVYTQAVIAPDTDSATGGPQGARFTGIFDGNNHTITNLTINQPTKDYIGLFGTVGQGGQVKNLGVEGTMAGRYDVGGLGGYNDSGTISFCYTIGSVSGAGYDVGGLAGSNSGTILSCYATGTVSGTPSYVGGLVGLNSGNITSSYATGNVIGSSSYIGGLAGWNNGTILSCYATGTVNGSSSVGGLVGKNANTIQSCFATGAVTTTGASPYYIGGLVGENEYGTITTSYAAGTVTATGNSIYIGGLVGFNGYSPYGVITACYAVGAVSGSSNVGGLVGYNAGDATWCFWDISTTELTIGANGTVTGISGRSTSQMKNYSTFTAAGWDFMETDGDPADWYAPVNNYPQLRWQSGQVVSLPALTGLPQTDAVPAITSAGLLVGTVSAAYSNSVPQGNVISQSPPAGINVEAGFAVNLEVSLGNHYTGGSGIPLDPYQIASVAAFKQFMATSADWNKHFILTADIDLGGEIFTRALITFFSGTFNGNSHVISNFSVLASGAENVGLFGTLKSSGQIKYLGVKNAFITGRFCVGGLVGRNDGKITSCYTSCSVIGTGDYVGGLAGLNSGQFASISGCYATGAVSGEYKVGGLAGGNSGTLSACYATGAVTGMGDYVGGLVGDNPERSIITSCYATGAVTGRSRVGGLAGSYYYGSSIIISCFWDIQTSGTSDGVGNMNPDPNSITGKTTAEMMMLSTFTSPPAGWDFTNETANGANEIWRMCADGVDYPRLNWESIDGDFACPDGVSVEDLDFYVGRWLMGNCGSTNNYCGGADINQSGVVDLGDAAILAGNWMDGAL